MGRSNGNENKVDEVRTIATVVLFNAFTAVWAGFDSNALFSKPLLKSLVSGVSRRFVAAASFVKRLCTVETKLVLASWADDLFLIRVPDDRLVARGAPLGTLF